MKNILIFLSFLLLSYMAYSQDRKSHKGEEPIEKSQRTNFDSLFNILSSQQEEIASTVDTIKTTAVTIKNNTEPQTIFGKFIENAFLQKSYDFFFGSEDKPGLIPFILSIVGFLVGVIRFIVLIVRFKKRKSESLQGVVISILLVIISFLMFVLSNRNFKSDEAIQLSKLEDQLKAVRNDIKSSQPQLTTVTNTNTDVSQVVLRVDKLSSDINEVKKSLNISEERIAKKIDDKGTHGLWIFINTVMLIVIVLLLNKDKIRELFS